MNKPLVSVVMPVYNGEKFLRLAIESILSQEFEDFEFIIIDDCSSDRSRNIIRSIGDKRIIYLENEINRGIGYSLNVGIFKARGKYIARMDADDISMPERFIRQIDFLEKNIAVGVIGAQAYLIDDKGRIFGRTHKHGAHVLIKWGCFFGSPMIHPLIMARSNILKENKYSDSYRNSQDYDLWSRLIFEKNIKFANINDYLLKLRIYKKSISSLRDAKGYSRSANITFSNIERYMPVDEVTRDSIIKFRSQGRINLSQLRRVYNCYKILFKKYEKKERLGPEMIICIRWTLLRFYLFLIRRFLGVI